MELDWLDDFAALAGSQSFSRAATSRNVTQPAFSRRIQMLEKWVGTALFQRLPRRVVLTPAGERFGSSVEGLTLAIRQARMEALDAAGSSSRKLSIAATHALSFTFFPHWAQRHVEATSLGALNLLSDHMAACEDMMLRGEASFLLCHRHSADTTRLPARQFKYHVVGGDVLRPYAAPDIKGAPLWHIIGNAAEAIPYLAYASPSGLGRIVDATWPTQKVRPHLKEVVTARLAAALLGMAEDGRGVAWLPASLAADSLQRGRLVGASDDPQFDIAVEIVLYRPIARLSATAEQFWTDVTTSRG